jgi:hypothetical protein
MKTKTKIHPILKETIKTAEALGFKYRADGVDFLQNWVTFTYPNTNSYVVYIDLSGTGDIMKKLGDELVKCGKIQLRQKWNHEFNEFNYEEE